MIYEQLLKDLYNTEEGLIPYSMYKIYKISPSQLAEFLNNLIEKGYLVLENNLVNLTESGRKYVEDLWDDTSQKEGSKTCQYYDGVFIGEQMEVNVPWMPPYECYLKLKGQA